VSAVLIYLLDGTLAVSTTVIAAVPTSPAVADQADVYINNDVIINSPPNHGEVSLTRIKKDYENPNLADASQILGFDWTRPFPGISVTGHAAHLRVAYDVPFTDGFNISTAVSSLTFSVPDNIAGKPMHPSWKIHRLIFVGTKSIVARDVDHNCQFLGESCIENLRSNLTRTWYPDIGMSSGIIHTSLPLTNPCWAKFGPANADVVGKCSTI
jgi:hypothetical protein